MISFSSLFAFFGNHDERLIVQHAIQLNEAKIMSIDEDIQRLTRFRHELEIDIAYKRALLSPIHRLPPELLGQIFLEFISVRNLDQFNLTARPFVLSQVSRQWRDIAHSIPALWTTFDFIEYGWPGRLGDYTHPTRCRLDMLITHSGELPLSFRYCSTFDVRSHSVFSRLVEVSPRWRDVWLRLPYSVYSEPLSLPNLECLTLEGGEKFSLAEANTLETFSLSPRLTRLSLQNCYHPMRAFSLPWPQIQRLHLKDNIISGSDYATILQQQATNLQSLLIENNHIFDPLSTTIVCTNIKSLTVQGNASYNVLRLLSPLVLPNLTHLHLRFWKPPDAVIDFAVQFLNRSGSSITHFTCAHLNDPWQMVRLLEEMPHLIHADLRGSIIGPSFVKRLNIRQHPRTQMQMPTSSPLSPHVHLDLDPESDASVSTPSSPPLPIPSSPYFLSKLEHLLLSDESLTPDLDGLTDAIISRIQISHESNNMGVISPLKHVKVTLRKEVEVTAISQLKELSKSGATVSLWG